MARVDSTASENTTVEYRPVPGFPGYRVGNDGSIWSCLKLVPLRGPGAKGTKSIISDEWRRLKPSRHLPKPGERIKSRHALGISLWRHNVGRRFLVHRLVLEVFVGPCPPGMEGCHDDGDANNNTLSNLRWDTKVANAADSRRHGAMPLGERHGCAKLTEEQVVAIRSRYAAGGVTQESLARDYGVSLGHVNDLVHRKRWAHVH